MAEARPIALDAMSGDNDPEAAVSGAREFVAAQPGRRILLVGDPARLDPLVAGTAGLEVVAAGDVIGMNEHPAQAVRAKPDSSIVVAAKLVAEGRASALVSAGNSGATLAAALLVVRRIPGVHRPALGALLPSASERTFLLDVGANTDCKPEWLLQFAVMGRIYAQRMLGVPEPRIGLLSNGEEAEKGSQLVQDTHALLAAEKGISFSGNIEGRDLFRGAVDVAVTDGFTGNIALKTAEGVGEFLFSTIGTAARSSMAGKIGGALLKPKLRPVRDSVDYRTTGGALLLGIAGEIVVAHGRSDALAMRNALGVAERAITENVSGRIADALGRPADAAAPTPVAATADSES